MVKRFYKVSANSIGDQVEEEADYQEIYRGQKIEIIYNEHEDQPTTFSQFVNGNFLETYATKRTTIEAARDKIDRTLDQHL